MAEMKEIVTVEQAERAIKLIAISLPIVGIAVGGAVGAVRRRPAVGLLTGLLCGAAGPLIWAMWRVYNVIIGRYGLDSVRGLLINLGLFILVGTLIGLAAAFAWRRFASPTGPAIAQAVRGKHERPS